MPPQVALKGFAIWGGNLRGSPTNIFLGKREFLAIETAKVGQDLDICRYDSSFCPEPRLQVSPDDRIYALLIAPFSDPPGTPAVTSIGRSIPPANAIPDVGFIDALTLGEITLGCLQRIRFH